MKPSEIRGFYHPKTKTFYYIDSTVTRVSAPLDRIMRVLIGRDLITPPLPGSDPNELQVMSLKEAQDKNYTTVALFATKHLQRLAKAEKTSSSIGWQE